jgi:broad specificity phosphatase PhoE
MHHRPTKLRGLSSSPGAAAGVAGGAKRVLFIRHGEAGHNVRWFNTERDTTLTPAGLKQVERLDELLEADSATKGVQVILASPLSRTIQTATKGCRSLIARGVPVELCALMAERNCGVLFPADHGSSKQQLARAWPNVVADKWKGLDELPDTWPSERKEFCWAQRVGEFREYLLDRPEKVVAVVGHGAFTIGLTGAHLGNAKFAWRTMLPDGSFERPEGVSEMRHQWDTKCCRRLCFLC